MALFLLLVILFNIKPLFEDHCEPPRQSVSGGGITQRAPTRSLFLTASLSMAFSLLILINNLRLNAC